MSSRWPGVCHEFHERVRASCWDSLAGQLIHLHQPHIFDGEPVCRGCDRQHAGSEADDPTWPCRTYTTIAATILGQPDVEGALTAMRRLSGVRVKR